MLATAQGLTYDLCALARKTELLVGIKFQEATLIGERSLRIDNNILAATLASSSSCIVNCVEYQTRPNEILILLFHTE